MMIQKHFEDIIRKKFGYDFSPTQQIAVEHFIRFFFAREEEGIFLLKGYAGKVKYAQFLHDRSELRFGKANASVTHKDELDEKDILLVLPDVRPDVEIPVIELISN